jgi:hypothetical protein
MGKQASATGRAAEDKQPAIRSDAAAVVAERREAARAVQVRLIPVLEFSFRFSFVSDVSVGWDDTIFGTPPALQWCRPAVKSPMWFSLCRVGVPACFVADNA